MTATTPTQAPTVGVRALPSPCQIGDTTITTGSGTPTATMNALRIGDLYIDYTNGNLYIATATGSASWQVYTAATASLTSGTTIGGTTLLTGSGTPIGTQAATRIGDLYWDYTNGLLYMAGAATNSAWSLLQYASGTPAAGGTQVAYSSVQALATLQAGATILPAITGLSYTILAYRIFTASGTPAGSGNFIISDTSGAQVALTASVAQLAAASSSGAAICDSTYTLATIGTYTGTKMTSGVGVKYAAMASLTGPYTMQLMIEYILTP
jgi:hypothetical protein